MALTAGVRLGAYEIHSAIGAGGMGEVWRARDTTLGRDVALKILPDHLSLDPERLARSKREAQILASLNHPNIATIHGFQEAGGVQALVLELVEGPTLADRIAQGPIPVHEALLIAKQIAEALEAAHEQGVIHRDLKPANIKVRGDGHVKVLDFGLAKLADPAGSGTQAAPSALSESPTTPAATLAGVILGTAAYMSPEQAKGKSVDRRTDIFSFGCVLYEMLAGRQAFQGESVSEILARVIEREPDWNLLPSGVSPRLRELIHRCLEKDPRKRRRDIGDVGVEIDRALSDPARAVAPRLDEPSTRRAGLAWIVAAALALALAGAIARAYWSAPTEPPETHLDVSTPETSDPTGFAISPDGRRLVFIGFRNGTPQLYLRSLDTDTSEPLNGTEGTPLIPFWSPDSRSIGFFADGQLKRMDIDGGLVQTVTPTVTGQGGTWGQDGMILFAPNLNGQLFRVSASGGEPVAVTTLGTGQSSHRYPSLLPGGRQFLFYATGAEEARGIYLGSLDSPETARLTDAEAAGVHVAPGWLLYARQGALVARRFDSARREVSGDPVTVAESVAVATVPRGAFSVSATGVIAYRSGGTSPSQLTWFDRSGHALGTLGQPDTAGLANVALSRDGRRAAVSRTVQNNLDVWVVDPERTTRFTLDPGVESYPIWSPDGTRVAFLSETGLHLKASGGSGADELLLASTLVTIPTDFSSDGRFLMYFEVNPKTGVDLWVLPLGGDRNPLQFSKTGFAELWGQFSPDGRWVAYQSNESGRSEIYVRPFPGPGGQWPISTSGGIYPRWRPDGKELYYLAPDGRLMAASITARVATLDVSAPVELFRPRIVGGFAARVGFRQEYDVAPDGRFLINVQLESAPPPIRLILNWRPR